MTLNGVIALNVCVITLNSVAFETDYVKVVEDTPLRSVAEM